MTAGRRMWAGAVALVAVAAVLLTGCFPAPVLMIIDPYVGTGVQGAAGDGGPAAAAQLSYPQKLAYDASGNLYIVDSGNHRVRRVTPGGTITTVAGTGTAGFSGDGGPAVAAQLNQPTGISVDGAGNLYIADMFNDRIRKVDVNGIISTFAGNGYHGELSLSYGGPAVNSSLSWPTGVTADSSGNVYIADTFNNRIKMVRPDGILIAIAGTGPGAADWSDVDGRAPLDLPLISPADVEIDANGDLLVLDGGASARIWRISGGTTTKVAGVIGCTYGGDGGAATSASMCSPSEMVRAPDGRIFVADTQNNRVRVISNGVMVTYAGNGGYGTSGDGGAATDAEIYSPSGIALAPDGSLVVSDTRSHRVRRIWAGGGAIGGRVTDQSSGAAVAGVTVRLFRTTDLVNPVATRTTDSYGNYGFSVVTGDYKVQVVAGGGYAGEWYSDASSGATATTVTVEAGDQDPANIALGH